ncbi:MAG: hypothetical protein AB1714_27105 [Acidobacteriota bacterium]
MDELLLDAIDDLILGRGVKRVRHDIPLEHRELFEKRLAELGFRPLTVNDVLIEPGTRVPAWVFGPKGADFGYVFWEIFTPRNKIKLFGSEARNAKGDWDVQITSYSRDTVWVNLSQRIEHDLTRPVGMI